MQANYRDCLAAPADHAACRKLIRAGSRSFFAASLLLPSKVREPALALYAFCRLADDAVDTGHDSDRLEQLRERLALAYAGRPAAFAADRAFAQVVAQFAIPRRLPEALLEGFQWDIEGRRYFDAEQLNGYAVRVAGSVGAMMACLMDTRAPHTVARACDLGVAMQLTNIARDVGEDARAGRLYLPLSWLQQAGVDPDAWIQRPVFTPGIGDVIDKVLAAADVLYERAATGITMLPANCRHAIRAAGFLYAEIGHELRRRGLDSVSRRTVVPPSRKLAVLTRAVIAGSAAVGAPHAPAFGANHPAPLEQARFLVAAVESEGSCARELSPTGFDQRVEWLAGLFERLECRDRGNYREPGAAA